jgi:hypothetical protein
MCGCSADGVEGADAAAVSPCREAGSFPDHRTLHPCCVQGWTTRAPGTGPSGQPCTRQWGGGRTVVSHPDQHTPGPETIQSSHTYLLDATRVVDGNDLQEGVLAAGLQAAQEVAADAAETCVWGTGSADASAHPRTLCCVVLMHAGSLSCEHTHWLRAVSKQTINSVTARLLPAALDFAAAAALSLSNS